MIQPTYISFEQAKLLPKNIFNTSKVYNESGKPVIISTTAKRLIDKVYYDRPQQWELAEWLRINHAIWIYVLPHSTLHNNKEL